MAITTTTLGGAMLAADTTVALVSVTGVTAPNFTTGAGIVYLQIDQEYMMVMGAPSGLFVPVQRGLLGTAAVAHVSGAQVYIGLPADFQQSTEFVQTSLTGKETIGGQIKSAINLSGLADAIPANVPGYYVIKSTAADLMTLAAPTAAADGIIIDIWSDTLFAHTLTATTLIANGTALKTTGTWPAFRGAGLTLRASNLVWHLIGNTAVVIT